MPRRVLAHFLPKAEFTQPQAESYARLHDGQLIEKTRYWKIAFAPPRKVKKPVRLVWTRAGMLQAVIL